MQAPNMSLSGKEHLDDEHKDLDISGLGLTVMMATRGLLKK